MRRDCAGLRGLGGAGGGEGGGDGRQGTALGLESGDIIHGINGNPISTVRDLRTALVKNPKLEMNITRDGTDMTLTEKPAKP